MSYLMRQFLLGICIALVSCGCMVQSKFRPPLGLLYTQVKAPLTTDFDETVVRDHYGESTSIFLMEPILGTSYAWDDCSLEKAAKDGNLKSVDYADYEFKLILGMFGQTTVRAYGEKQ